MIDTFNIIAILEDFQMIQHYNTIVYIGRFQPVHLAHIEIIKTATSLADNVVILIGSAFQPRTIKNPWTWKEREEMIVAALPESIQSKVTLIPLRDILYNNQQWVSHVQTLVPQLDDDNNHIGLIGHTKDHSSYYLQYFPQWSLIEHEQIKDVHSTDIRKLLFEHDKISPNLPPEIRDYINAFRLMPEYEQLVREYEFIDKYKKSWKNSPYPPTFCTVDAVVIQSGHILLVRRRSEPGRGLWAMPGGFINEFEQIIDAVIRELREETKLKIPVPVLKGSIKHQKVYDDPNRSLRGRTITHTYLIELPPGPLPKVKGSSDATKAGWIPLSTFKMMESQMFEDHYHIINDILGKL